MNLAQLKAAIQEITNRPDLSTEVDNAISRALLAAHLSSTYYFDLATTTFNVVNDSQDQSFPNPARFREVKYARIPSSADDGFTKLKKLSASSLFDSNVYLEQSNIFYRAGTNIVFRLASSMNGSQIQLGYYQLPDTADSWILANFPDALINHGVADIYSLMKNRAMAQEYRGYYAQNVQQLMQIAFDP